MGGLRERGWPRRGPSSEEGSRRACEAQTGQSVSSREGARKESKQRKDEWPWRGVVVDWKCREEIVEEERRPPSSEKRSTARTA